MIFNKLFNDYSNNNIGGLTDELKCIYIANNFKENTLVVCNSLYEANKFYQTLKNYVDNVYFFPMDDFMTSQVLAISPDFKMTRLETLNNIDEKCIVVTNLMGYLRFLPPKDVFKKSFIKLKVNDDIKDLATKLYDIGYEKDIVINKSGDMAIRGYVIDVFPINYDNPIRIEFWGDTIESIRKFDINTQLTIETINAVEIIPNTENLSSEYVDIYSYLNGKVYYNEFEDIKTGYEQLMNEVLEYDASKKYFFDFKEYDSIKLSNNYGEFNYNSFKIEDRFANIKDILKYKDKTIVICVSNRYQANKIIDEIDCVFTNINQIFDKKINVVIFNINEGFIFNDYVFISENEIFNKKNTIPYKTNFKYGWRLYRS